MKLKKIEDVLAAVEVLRHLGDEATFGQCIDLLKGRGYKGRDIVGIYIVLLGRALPETVLLACPAADHLRGLSLELQRKHVLEREPFEVIEYDENDWDPDRPPVQKVFDELTEANCEVLFLPSVCREIAVGIDRGSKMSVELRDGKMVGFSRMDVERPEPPRKGPRRRF